MVNRNRTSRKIPPTQPLEQLSETATAGDNGYANQTIVQFDDQWRNLPAKLHQAALDHVEVYLDDFNGVFQRGTEERRQITKNLFCSIYLLLFPKNPLDVVREEQISLKKLEKIDAKWSTKKTLLGWEIYTAHQILTLPSIHRGKLVDSMAAISNQAAIVPKKK